MEHFLVSIVGLWLLFLILRSMIRIALIHRHYRDWFAEAAGRVVYRAVALKLRGNRDTRSLHSVLLWLFPAYLLSLILVYFVGTMTAFTFLYWGTAAVGSWRQAFLASGSALNTLGFATPSTNWGQCLAVPEGALGLGIVVFFFTFIPGYQTVIRAREDKTSQLYVRTSDQPTGVALLEWCQRAGIGDNLRDVWEAWEDWFRMLGDTHSILPMLTVSPSTQENQSWVLAAAAVLDAAAFAACSIETSDAESARICLRTGTRALLAIAESLGRVCHSPAYEAQDPVRERYCATREHLRLAGITLVSEASLEIQWQELLAYHRQYEPALLFVARQTFTPMERLFLETKND